MNETQVRWITWSVSDVTSSNEWDSGTVNYLECFWHHLVKWMRFRHGELPGVFLTSPRQMNETQAQWITWCELPGVFLTLPRQMNEIQARWITWSVSDITSSNEWDSGTVNYLECFWHHLVKWMRLRHSELPGVFLTSPRQMNETQAQW